jgi:hypothetical protein
VHGGSGADTRSGHNGKQGLFCKAHSMGIAF